MQSRIVYNTYDCRTAANSSETSTVRKTHVIIIDDHRRNCTIVPGETNYKCSESADCFAYLVFRVNNSVGGWIAFGSFEIEMKLISDTERLRNVS